MTNLLVYYPKGNTFKCRICGKNIGYNEPRLSTSVMGYRSSIGFAIHIHHLSQVEIDKIIVENL